VGLALRCRFLTWALRPEWDALKGTPTRSGRCLHRYEKKGALLVKGTLEWYRDVESFYCLGLASGCVAALCFLR